MFRQICASLVLASLLVAGAAQASFFEDKKDSPKCLGRKVSEIGTGLALRRPASATISNSLLR